MYPSDRTVALWHAKLRYFRFHRGPGGHGGDMDTLAATLPFARLEELISILEQIGCPLQRIPPGAPRIEKGRAYSHEEFRRLPEPLAAFPDYASPGACRVLGCPCLMSVGRQAIDICLCGSGDPPDYWSVTRRDFHNALKLEQAFDRLGLRVHATEGGV